MPDFRSVTPNRGLTRLGMQQQSQQQLTQEAFSLSPDTDAVTKAILDKKLYNADMAPVQEEVNGIVGDYMEKFNKDPFYAFSREGRKTAGVLKNIINHPSIKEWEQNTAKSEEEYKRASDNRLNKNLVVRGNDVLAIKDGKRQYISLNEIKALNPEKGDRLLDVDSDIQAIRNNYGVRGGAPSYDMTKLDDIDSKIKAAFTDLGSNDQTSLIRDTSEGVDIKLRRKSNERQLNTALRTFMTTGLSESDKNTLRSEYVKSYGGEASPEGFHKWLSDKLSGIASGKLTTVREDVGQESITSKARSGGGGAPKTVELSTASKVIQGVTGNRKVVDVIGNAGQSLQGNLLPVQETLGLSSGHFKDEFNNTYPNRTVKNLKIFSDATDLKNLSVRNEKTGAWEKLPGLGEHGVVVDKPGSEPALVWQYSYTDPTGEQATVPLNAAKEILDRRNQGKPIPASLQKYMTTLPIEEAEARVMRSSASDEDKQRQIVALRSQVSSDGVVRMLENKPWIDFSVILPKAKGMFQGNVSGEEQEIGNQLSNFGYQSKESDAMREYHKNYSGRGDVTNAPGSFWSVDDEFYEVKSRVPLTSFEQLNSVYGGKTLGYTEDIHIDSSKLRDNYELMSPNLFNSGTLPNMTGTKARVTIDDIQ